MNRENGFLQNAFNVLYVVYAILVIAAFYIMWKGYNT